VQSSVIEMIGGSSGKGATEGNKGGEGTTGDDGCIVSHGNGGMSYGSGIRSSEEGMVFLTGGSGISLGC